MPRVSVIIPTYNRGSFLVETISSVLAQTYRDYEIICVDDGSTDDTKEIIDRFGDSIRYIYQENQGVSSARNTGIEHARGDYVAFLDSDDHYVPQKLQKQINYIYEHPKCRFLYSWYYKINKKDRTKVLKKNITCKKQDHLKYALLTRRLNIRMSTVIVHRKCFNLVGRFNEKYRRTEDWDMWLRLAAHYNAHCINEPLVYYYRHGQNLSEMGLTGHWEEVKNSTMDLYGWSEKSLIRLRKKYGKIRDTKLKGRWTNE